MKEIIFVGNPNAGKSTLFNALAHAHAHTGNWNGVTVGAFSKTVKTKQGEAIYTDLPGIYSFNCYSLEERQTKEYLYLHKNCLIVNVIDVRYLSRSLLFTRELLNREANVIIALTMCKRFYKNGGKADINEISERIGVPVYAVDAFSVADVDVFNTVLQNYCFKSQSSVFSSFSDVNSEKGKAEIKRNENTSKLITEEIYAPQKRKETIIEKLCYNRFLCLPLFFCLLGCVFFLTFGNKMPGTICKEWLENLICEKFSSVIASRLSTPAIRALVCEGFLRSAGGVLSFLPQITLLYAFLLFMEESGYMSVLAFSADGVFRKFGLNGRAVFCILLGFGCTAQAILSTRGFEKKTMQNRTIAALPYISCSAKLPVYLTLLSAFFSHPFIAVAGLYLTGVAVTLCVFAFLSRGEKGDFILEIPEMQLPNSIFFVKTLLFRLKQFIIKIVTVVTAFTLIVWFVSSFDFKFRYVPVERSMLAFFCDGLKYVFYPIGVRDWQTAFALFSGLVAKENVAGLLTLFYPEGLAYSTHTAVALAVFVLFCSPCVSAIVASAREIGWSSAFFNAVLQTATAVFAAYVTYYVLETRVLLLGLLLLLTILFLAKRFCFERIHRSRGGLFKKFHG